MDERRWTLSIPHFSRANSAARWCRSTHLKFIQGFATVLFLLFGTHDGASNAQVNGTQTRSGGSSVVATNITPRLREIGANYFEALKQSQVWMNVEPQPSKGEPAPVILNVTVAFPGLRLNQGPATVQIRAESIGTAFPLRIRQPILRFVMNRRTTIDLTAPGSSYQFVARCEDGPRDMIVADLSFDSLRDIAGATDVAVDAFGFSLRLAPADLAALRVFVRAVENGVVVRPR